MTYPMRYEGEVFCHTPPDAVVFQSAHQANRLREGYVGVPQTIIHGACEPLPFRPVAHEPGTPFVVGRLARASRTKWSPYLWYILGAVRRCGVDVRALCMGWNDELTLHCGKPPAWATCLPQDTLSSEAMLAQCHALICTNGRITENWPRVGLEAMAAGVPLVVDDSGGWREQLGDAGLFCTAPSQFADALYSLATDEGRRVAMIAAGRNRLAEVADGERLMQGWRAVLGAA